MNHRMVQSAHSSPGAAGNLSKSPLLHWQQAALDVACDPTRCDLHRLVSRHLRVDGLGPDEKDAEVCALIRTTVGCPLLRGLPTIN